MKVARIAVLSAFMSLSAAGGAFAEQAGYGSQSGYLACIDWCSAHNRTVPSYRICSSQCKKYWNPRHPVIGRQVN